MILTGHMYGGGGSLRLYRESLAHFCRMPVHSSVCEGRRLEQLNDFDVIIRNHTPECPMLYEEVEL